MHRTALHNKNYLPPNVNSTKVENSALNKWRGISCSLIWRLNPVKMPVLKWIYKFNIISIPEAFWVEIDKPIVRCIWKCKGYGVGKQCFKIIKWEDLHYQISKLTVNSRIKTVWYWYKNRSIDDGTESPETLTFVSFDFWQKSKGNSEEKEKSIQQMVLGGELYICMQKKRKRKKTFTSYHTQKLNSNWIIDLNLRAKIFKLLEKNVEAYFWLSEDFLHIISKV